MKKQKIKKLRLPPIGLEMLEFPLNRHISDSAPPKITAPTGDPNEVERLYRCEIDEFNESLGGSFARVPFAWTKVSGEPFGDFTGIQGERIFRHIRARFVGGHWSRPLKGVARDLRRFAITTQASRFQGGERCACIQGVHREGDLTTFDIGVAPYEHGFATIGSQGVHLSLDRRQLAAVRSVYDGDGDAKVRVLKKLVKQLRKRFGDCTIREALHKLHKGVLPPFGSPFVDSLGGMIALITAGKYVVLGLRTPGNVSVNFGINVASSGGFTYEPEEIESMGFSSWVESQMRRELEEELGIPGNACTITVLAFTREAARAGASDFVGLIEFSGSLDELVHLARTNPIPIMDVDRLYAIPIAQAREMITRPHITKVIHPKAVMALILWHRYLSLR